MSDNAQVPCVLHRERVHASVLLLASSLRVGHVVQVLLVFCVQICAASANPICNLRGTRRSFSHQRLPKTIQCHRKHENRSNAWCICQSILWVILWPGLYRTCHLLVFPALVQRRELVHREANELHTGACVHVERQNTLSRPLLARRYA